MPRRLRRFRSVIVFGAFLAAVIWLGIGIALSAALVLLLFAFGFGYPLYLWAVQQRAARRPVAIEATRLVQRNKSGRIVAVIDLAAPFAARCEHEDAEWVLYRATQGREVMWLTVPTDGDGRLVQALRLPWPPAVPSFWYL